MAGCKRCTQLPDPVQRHGVLCVAYPEDAAGARLRQYLRAAEISFEEREGVICVHLGEGTLDKVCNDYFASVSKIERQDTKCLVVDKVEDLSIQALLRTKSLEIVLTQVQGGWLRDLLAEERLVSYFHPIVSCSAPDEAFAYECLARGLTPEGDIIPPNKLFSFARDGEMLFQLDRACRLAAIRDAHKNNLKGNIFINFNPTAIYDPEYCLRTTVKAIEDAGIEQSRIVFEVVESDEVKDSGHLLTILSFYRSHGFRVALDDLGAGYGSLNLLHKLRPDFIKLDMDLIRGVHEDPFKASISANLLELARKLGIRSVAEGVETAGEWEWVKANGGDLAQGYYFAKPAPHAWSPNTV